MAKMRGMMIMMAAVMVILVSPSHAKDQSVEFDIKCFMKCAPACLQNTSLPCLIKCIKTCAAPPPSPPPSPSSPPPPPMSPKTLAATPTSPLSLSSSADQLKSCNLECAFRDCSRVDTDMEKLNCMENCFELSCDDH